MVGNLNIFLMKNKKPKSQKKLRKKLKYVTNLQQLKVPLNVKGIQKMQLGFKVILTKQVLGTEA